MKKFSIFFILALALTACSPTQDAEFAACMDYWESQNFIADTDYVPGELSLGFEEELTEAEIADFLATYSQDLTLKSRFQLVSAAVVTVPVNSEFKWICTLSSDPGVNYIEPNFINTLDN